MVAVNTIRQSFEKLASSIVLTKAVKPPPCAMPVEGKTLSKQTLEAVAAWTGRLPDTSIYKGISHSTMRQVAAGNTKGLSADQIKKSKRALKLFEDFLAKAPKHKGIMHRALVDLDDFNFEQWTKVGGRVRVQALSSFSTDIDVATRFVNEKMGKGSYKNVIIEVTDEGKGRLLGKLSAWGEKEVILPANEIYEIKSVTRFFHAGAQGATDSAEFKHVILRRVR